MRTGIFFLLFLSGLSSGCTTHNKLKQEHTQRDQAAAPGADIPGAPVTSVQAPADEPVRVVPSFTPGPPALVYKTKADYHNLVPVLLSADKKTIISYPHPKDLVADGKYPVPAVLHEGYLLDNRGISAGVAYLNMDYKTYAALEEAPPLQELYDLILEKDPLTTLYDCGNRTAFDDPEKQLNLLIDQGRLQTDCRKLK